MIAAWLKRQRPALQLQVNKEVPADTGLRTVFRQAVHFLFQTEWKSIKLTFFPSFFLFKRETDLFFPLKMNGPVFLLLIVVIIIYFTHLPLAKTTATSLPALVFSLQNKSLRHLPSSVCSAFKIRAQGIYPLACSKNVIDYCHY